MHDGEKPGNPRVSYRTHSEVKAYNYDILLSCTKHLRKKNSLEAAIPAIIRYQANQNQSFSGLLCQQQYFSPGPLGPVGINVKIVTFR